MYVPLLIQSSFLPKNQTLKNGILVLAYCLKSNFLVRMLQCKKKVLPMKTRKKPPQKIAYLSRNSVFQKFSFYCPTAQMSDFMIQNVAYRTTVYRTGSNIK